MKKYLFVCFTVLLLTAVISYSQDDIESTRVVVSKGITGYNSEPTYARNELNSSSVIVWSNVNYDDGSSKIYAVYVKPKSGGKFKFSKPRLVSNKTDYNINPSVAYNADSNCYMVVWGSQVKNNDIHLLARKLNSTGRPRGGIVKVSSENLAQNSYPSISTYYEPLIGFSPAAPAPRFIVVWDKGWPNYINTPSGLHCVQLDAAGKKVSPETFVFASPKDPGTNEPVPLLTSNIAPVFGGWYYVAVNRGYSNAIAPPAENRDTWLLMFASPTDWYPAVKSFSGIRTAGKLLTTADQGVIHTWYDGLEKELTYTRVFKHGPKAAGGIKKPIRKETTYGSCLSNQWSSTYLYNYGGDGEVKIFEITEKGKVKKHVGTLNLEDPMGQYMFAYWANTDKKTMLVSEVLTDDQNFHYDIIAYHFDGPDWQNQEGSEGR